MARSPRQVAEITETHGPVRGGPRAARVWSMSVQSCANDREEAVLRSAAAPKEVFDACPTRRALDDLNRRSDGAFTVWIDASARGAARGHHGAPGCGVARARDGDTPRLRGARLRQGKAAHDVAEGVDDPSLPPRPRRDGAGFRLVRRGRHARRRHGLPRPSFAFALRILGSPTRARGASAREDAVGHMVFLGEGTHYRVYGATRPSWSGSRTATRGPPITEAAVREPIETGRLGVELAEARLEARQLGGVGRGPGHSPRRLADRSGIMGPQCLTRRAVDELHLCPRSARAS
jgi:endonuclease YncB( thermonuclease family)